jgi:hypothetical protein
MTAREGWPAPLLMAVLCLLAAFAYWPGLQGGFLFDDFVNLDAIGATGPVDDWPTFVRYVTSGTADPTGRPLALLSFLLDARDWPADPLPFLRTNVLLQLLNGVLLWRLLVRLAEELSPAARWNALSAALAAGLWLLHPLLVSTTLYIVQREAMLPATFVLAGLLCFFAGRHAWFAGRHRRGAWLMIAGIAGGTTLAVLCKANGALLPLLALVIDSTIPPGGQAGGAPSWRAWRVVLLWVPSAMVIAYLASFLPGAGVLLPHRGWTIWQRLLTEGRVLLDYLQLLVVPRSISSGLYNDGYLVSRGLFTPASTLPSLVLVLALPATAFATRRRAPRLAAGVLFYFAAQLLESSVVPLELYFEHRNYLPSLLLAWPLAHALVAGQRLPALRCAAAVVLVALLTATTWQRARLWGQPDRLAILWAQESPGSSRAQATLAMLEVRQGRADRAILRLEPLRRQRPLDLQVALNVIDAACASGALSNSRASQLDIALAGAREALQMVPPWLSRAIEAASARQCPGLDLRVAARWLESFASNPVIARDPAFVQDLEPLRAQLALAWGDGPGALRHFDSALLAHPTPDVAARQAAMLARHGRYREALAHIDLYERERVRMQAPARGMPWLHAWVLDRQGYWPREMAVLRAKLHAEIAATAVAPPGGKEER